MLRVVVYQPGMWPDITVNGQREELCAWLRANGITPEDVPISAEISIEPLTLGGGRAIRHTVYLRDADGRKYLDETGDEAAQEERLVPLVTEPPPHWPAYEENDR